MKISRNIAREWAATAEFWIFPPYIEANTVIIEGSERHDNRKTHYLSELTVTGTI